MPHRMRAKAKRQSSPLIIIGDRLGCGAVQHHVYSGRDYKEIYSHYIAYTVKKNL